MEKNFVTFLSPGTFLVEQTRQPIKSWDVKKAIEMSKNINKRYGALPYGFYFTARGRSDDDLDSKEIKRSNMYYLGGQVFTLQEVKDRKNPKDRILISNMECNGWDKIIVNDNSWQWARPLKESDVVLDYSLQG